MLFVQTSAPTGWTKITTHNDKALRVVSGSVSTGGSVAFTTAFASRSVTGTVGSTSLSTAQLASHTHQALDNAGNTATQGFMTLDSTSSGSNGFAAGALWNTYYQHSNGQTQTNGSGSTHNHSFTGTAINLAVNYVDVIIASKD